MGVYKRRRPGQHGSNGRRSTEPAPCRFGRPGYLCTSTLRSQAGPRQRSPPAPHAAPRDTSPVRPTGINRPFPAAHARRIVGCPFISNSSSTQPATTSSPRSAPCEQAAPRPARARARQFTERSISYLANQQQPPASLQSCAAAPPACCPPPNANALDDDQVCPRRRSVWRRSRLTDAWMWLSLACARGEFLARGGCCDNRSGVEIDIPPRADWRRLALPAPAAPDSRRKTVDRGRSGAPPPAKA